MANSNAISTYLSTILDLITGTKDIVDARRKTSNIYSAFSNVREKNRNKRILCGSLREGCKLAWSDYDTMLVDTYVVVIEQGSDFISDKFTLRMIYDQQHTGSVLLEPLNRRRPYISMCVNYRGRNVLSSTMYRDYLMCPDSTSNGPCVTGELNGGLDSYDICYSFECPTWPSIANEFVNRDRKYGWPSPAVMSCIVNDGCYCVPIGDKISDHSYVQWRLSFAPAEVRLVHTFSHCEFKVYTLLKILNNDILKKIVDHTDGKPLLSSYHLTTIMFLLKENSPNSYWSDDNMFKCFWMCFNFLIECVEKGFLPQFFIPSNNLFRTKIFGVNRQKLLKCFYSLQQKGIGVVYACCTLQPYLVQVQAGCNMSMTPSHKELKYDIALCQALITDIRDDNWLPCILHVISNKNDICVYTSLKHLTRMLIKKASSLYNSMRELNLDNKQMYNRRRICRHYLLFGTNTDVGAGWLDLATNHYLIGQYRLALTMCQHVMSSIKPWTLICSGIIQYEAYEQKFCGQGINILSKMKRAFSTACSFKKSEMYLKEIIPEILNPTEETVFIYPQPYAAFLSFLCFHQTADVPGQHAALSDLLALQYDKIQGIVPGQSNNYIIYNLIGICYEILGEYHNAVIMYLKSAAHNHHVASVALMRAEHIIQYMRREN